MRRAPENNPEQRLFHDDINLMRAGRYLSYFLMCVAATRLIEGDYNGAVAEMLYATSWLFALQTLSPNNSDLYKSAYLCTAVGIFSVGRAIDPHPFISLSFISNSM